MTWRYITALSCDIMAIVFQFYLTFSFILLNVIHYWLLNWSNRVTNNNANIKIIQKKIIHDNFTLPRTRELELYCIVNFMNVSFDCLCDCFGNYWPIVKGFLLKSGGYNPCVFQQLKSLWKCFLKLKYSLCCMVIQLQNSFWSYLTSFIDILPTLLLHYFW